MIIPENERSQEPMKGERVLSHPDMVRANEWVLSDAYTAPHRDYCIFVPCAKVKPYHDSPSHKMYDRIVFSILRQDEAHIVTFGTCGITPRELDEEYPFMDYEFMLGRCNVASVKDEFVRNESKKLARYLDKTRDCYKYRIAYCIGDFRRAMEKALTITDVAVTIVPKPQTLEANVQPNKPFKFGSLSRRPYLQDLSDTLTSLKNASPRTVGVSEQSLNDTDWYLV
jgi:predicted RNA-binding protein